MVGNDREGFERGARERPAFLLVAAQQEAEVLCGAEGPFVAAPHQIDAPVGVARLQRQQKFTDVSALPHIC
ncbi:hypothetical protein D3C72_2381500 [compost metagenome]